MRATRPPAGRRCNLGPGELPIDRVLELAKRIDELTSTVNQVLGPRPHPGSEGAEPRDRRWTRAVRDVEAAAAEVAQARGDMQGAAEGDWAALRDQVKQVEAEEVETAEAVIGGRNG